MASNSIIIAHGGDISESSGGMNRVTSIAKCLRDGGFDVHLVVTKPRSALPADLKGIKVHPVPLKESLGIVRRLLIALMISITAKRLMKATGGRLQIEYATLGGIATLVGCSGFILDMHDLSFPSLINADVPFAGIIQRLIYTLEKRAVRRASRIITVSQPMRGFIIKEWGIPKERVYVVPNGYFKSGTNGNISKKITDANHIVTFMGTLHPKIDVDKIIDLARTLDKANIYIIGDGTIREKLAQRVRDCGLQNVNLTGRLTHEKAMQLIAMSTVVIFPQQSYLETEVSCPVKLFDYAALGKAIVADEVSEVCYLLKKNHAAMVSPPSEPGTFIENVRTLLNHRELRHKLGNNAREFVKDFTWEKQAGKVLEIHQNLNGNNKHKLSV